MQSKDSYIYEKYEGYLLVLLLGAHIHWICVSMGSYKASG